VQYYRTTGEVGLYQIAGSIAMGMALLTTAFQQAWGPFAMSIYKHSDAKAVYARVFLVCVWFFSLLGTGLSLLTPELIRILATQRYAGANAAVPYLVFGYIMLGLYNIAAIGPTIAKETRLVGAAFVIAAIVNTGLNFLLIPGMGKEGAAISTLVSYAILPVYVFYRSRHIFTIPYRFDAASGIFALSFVLILALHDWHPQSLWIGVAGKLAVLLVFIPAAFAFQVVTVKQVRQLLRRRLAGGAA
jgi:O-antigen/teichoic acid export membrane protein